MGNAIAGALLLFAAVIIVLLIIVVLMPVISWLVAMADGEDDFYDD